jgi:recombination protein RecA
MAKQRELHIVPISGKRTAVDSALEEIDKKFGAGSAVRLGSSPQSLEFDIIPTGSIALDVALGIGGLPKGRIVEIYGPEAVGKTTLVQHIIAEVQKLGGTAAFVDAEHALDLSYAKKCGVDIENLIVSQPDYGEAALDIADYLIRSGGIDCVVIDSVAALVPKQELNDDMETSHVGLQARMMGQAIRKLTGAVHKYNVLLIFTNQIREKVGVFYGSNEVIPGGRALKFGATIRLDMRRADTLKTGTEPTGSRVRVKVAKNKVAAPFRVAEYDITFGEGISHEGGLIDVGVAMGIVVKSGTWFSFGEKKLGQGREQAKDILKESPDIAKEIETKIYETFKTGSIPTEGIMEAE